MHRATPLTTSFRGYVSGGARAVVDKVDDSKLMQEMGGNFMKNESRDKIEAPQNYGFTSVVFDADKDANGKITGSAETFIQFMHGNRSFPVSGNMDDRRHRLYGMEKGDTAMFRGKDDQQQFHMTKDGGYWSAPQGKTMRMALVPQKQQQQQQAKAGTQASSGAQADQGQQQQQQRGQKPIKKDNEGSKYFVELNSKKQARTAGKDVHLMLDDDKEYVDINGDDKGVYLGARHDKKPFAIVATLSGPAVDVYAKLIK